MKAIRGAITCENTVEDILSASVQLLEQIMLKNSLSKDTITAIVFSATQDLDAVYPALALRERLDFSDIPMMCTQEMNVKGSLSHCIRVMVFADIPASVNINHCYLNGAKCLRPDLQK